MTQKHSPLLFSLLPVLFSVTLFLSSGLLFLIEPMIAKMVLPLLGGTPAVWNTCMMFFQAMLLAGYGYAHISTRKAGVGRQIVIHMAVLVIACIVLPVAIPRIWTPPAEGSPIGYILLLLTVSVGPPFFVLSSTAPLLQKWFADTGHPSAKDPYFLYSASNLGSMLALISYPTLIEPYFRLAEQGRSWSAGYVMLAAFTVFCSWLTWKYLSACLRENSGNESDAAETCVADDSRLTARKRLEWTLLAFVPSSLMLGVTTFLSTDVAAIPLFWTIPLSLYLLSFIIVFARVPAAVHRAMVFLLPLSITALIFVNFSDVGIPKWAIFLFHLANFFVYCMVCHGELARSRPTTKHLTEFYLLISVGGVLGGIFNALIAPVTFSAIVDYPLVLVLGAVILPVRSRKGLADRRIWKNVLPYMVTVASFVALTYWITAKQPVERIELGWLEKIFHAKKETVGPVISYGSLGLLCWALVLLKRPFIFGTGVAALLMTMIVSDDLRRNIVHRERSFFGVLTVTKSSDNRFLKLSHGTTLHGKQWLDPGKRLEPVAYYHPKGPIGQVFSEFSGKKKKPHIAVTGLGTGTLAVYAGKGQKMDIYEIDPAVKKISTNPAYFSYLDECRADWKIVLGDARLTMEKAPDNYYGIIILDAFSSDAIPVHLLTEEAIALYLSKLEQDGVLMVHISNKYVDLAPVLGRLAEEKGLASRICDDDGDTEIEKFGSTWVLLAREEKNLGNLAKSGAWKHMELIKTVKAWTDDFSNILSVFKW